MKPNGMGTIFRYRLTRLRGQVLGWGMSLGLLGLFMAQFYGTVLDQADQFEQLLANYPKELMAFFGDFTDLASPSGYLNLEYFVLMPLVLGIFAVLTGSGLLVGDEESGRLDLIMAHPISRSALFWGRLLAFVVATVAILALAWLGIYIPSAWTPLDVSSIGLTLAFVSLFAVLMLFGMLALLSSMLLPSRRMTAMVSGIALVGSYFATSLARINADLEPIAKLSPLTYYQGGEAIGGLDATSVIGVLAAVIAFAILAWWRFEQRDIRVGGEGAWQPLGFSWLLRRLSRRLLARRKLPASERVMAEH